MSNRPQIIAVDLDGTVFGADHKSIPKRTMACLEEFIDRGSLLIPVTGRIHTMIPVESFPPFRYLISSNGGYIFDLQEQQVLRTSYIPREYVKAAWELVKERVERFGIVMELYVDDRMVVEQKICDYFPLYAPNLPPFHQSYISGGKAECVSSFDEYLANLGDHVVKINFPGQSIRHCPELREELSSLGTFEVTSDGLNLELNRKGCNKGEALQWLSAQLGITADHVVAFGNGDNDISMLSFAGWGVAMGNSAGPVKAAARYCTLANTEDGIAHFLEEQFPIGKPDLQKATQLLLDGGYTCVFCRDDEVITDSRRGVTPLLSLLDSGRDLRGFSAADKVVGKAAAFLYCILGVRELYALVISAAAMEVLDSAGVAVTCDRVVNAIMNRTQTGYCPMESAVWDISDARQALVAIRQKRMQLMGS